MDVVRKSHFELAETTTTNHQIEEGFIDLTEDVRLLCDWAIKRHQLDMYFKFVDENLLITEDQGSTFKFMSRNYSMSFTSVPVLEQYQKFILFSRQSPFASY